MIYILLAAVLYTAALLLGAYASRHANTSVVAAITNIISATIPIAAVAYEWSRHPLQNERAGLIAAAFGGVAVAFFVLVLNKSFVVNKVAVVSPIVFGGAIFLSAILGWIIFKERITPYQGVGLILLAIGLGFITYAKATGK